MRVGRKSVNAIVLLIFATILILTGILGFLVPAGKGLMSGAPAYNIFHIAAGSIGLLLVLASKQENLIRAFNVGFGGIDLYQFAASVLHVFPEQLFRWQPADDVVHILIGTGLVLVGLYSREPWRQPA